MLGQSDGGEDRQAQGAGLPGHVSISGDDSDFQPLVVGQAAQQHQVNAAAGTAVQQRAACQRQGLKLQFEGEGETLAIRRAYEASGVDPASIGLVEAHGTGIPLGDRTEIASLKAVFGDRQAPIGTKALGSVKSMISHCIPAAGITRDSLAVRFNKETGKTEIYPVETFRRVLEVNLMAPIYWGIEMVAHIVEDRARRGLKRWHAATSHRQRASWWRACWARASRQAPEPRRFAAW